MFNSPTDTVRPDCFVHFKIIVVTLSNQTKSQTIKSIFLVREENWSTQGKMSQTRVEEQQTQPSHTVEAGIESRPHTVLKWKASGLTKVPPSSLKSSIQIDTMIVNAQCNVISVTGSPSTQYANSDCVKPG